MIDLLGSFRNPRRHSRRNRASLVFGEALERRTLLSGNVSASVDDGDLLLWGDSSSNSVEVTTEGGTLVVRGLNGTTINDSTDDFVIAGGATTFEGDVHARLGRGSDTLRLTGGFTIGGSVHSHDFSGKSQFAITDATIKGDVHLRTDTSEDLVSLVNATINGNLRLALSRGDNFVSLSNTNVGGQMSVVTGKHNDVILLDGSTVGGLHARTGNRIDQIILLDSTINGNLRASTGADRDNVYITDSTIAGDSQLWLWGASDVIATQGTNEFAGDFFAGGILGRRDTIELSTNTTIGGKSRIVRFERESLDDLTDVNDRINRRLAEVLEFQILLNNVELGDLTLAVDTSSNTNVVESNNTLIARGDTLTLEGTTLRSSTVGVTSNTNGEILELGEVTTGSDGNYSIVIDLPIGPTVITVTSTDILDRSIAEEFNLHVAVGTVMRFQSSQGTFDVELFDETTPETVANFLNYSNRYVDSIVHRKAIASTEGVDVIQGGGFALNSSDELQEISTDPPVMSEANPQNSNVRGTIAMALFGNDPNSGTSQWYINVNDNTSLDSQGFTVFGEVIGNGMTVVDTIFALERFNVDGVVPAGGGALTTVPLNGYVPEVVQLTGTVSIDLNSITVAGTGTQFTTELNSNDTIIIGGEEFRVVAIISDTQLLVNRAPAMAYANANIFSPMVTTAPTRDEYVVFSSIGAILT